MINDLDIASNLKTSPDVLDSLAKSRSTQVRVAVANNPNTVSHILRVLAKSVNTEVLCAVIKNPNTTVEIIKSIFNNSNGNSSISLNLANKNDVPPDILEQLAKTSTNIDVLIAISKNPSTTVETLAFLAELLERLAFSGCREAGVLIASEENTSPDILEQLAKTSTNIDVLIAISKNPIATIKTLTFLAELGDYRLYSELKNNPKVSSTLLENMLERLAFSGYREPGVLIASGENTPSDILEQLAKTSTNTDVLIAVSKNSNATTETFAFLTESGDYHLYSELKNNPKVSSTLLEKMLERLAFLGCREATVFITRREKISAELSNSSLMQASSVYDTGFEHWFEDYDNHNHEWLKHSRLPSRQGTDDIYTDPIIVLNILHGKWIKTPFRYREHSNFLAYLDDLIAKKLWLESKYFYPFEDNCSAELNFWAGDGYFEKTGAFSLYELISIDLLEDVKIIYQNQDTTPIKTKPSTGFKIPPPPEPLEFDTKQVANIKAESKKVAAMLDAIYEQDNVAPTVSNSSKTNISSVLNLDETHLEIVKTLATRQEWERNELAVIMKGMMIDGVLEYINEAFFDDCEESFVDGYDPIEINISLYKEIFK